MRIHLVLAAALCAAATTALADFDAGPYRADVTGFVFNDLAGNPHTAIVMYPLSLADGSPLPAGETYDVTVFGQGGNIDAYRYQWLRNLAADGHIIVMPDVNPVAAPSLNDDTRINTNTKLTSVEILDQALRGFITWAADPTSEVFGRFSGRAAYSGHSFGGVMAIIAVDEGECDQGIGRCPPLYSLHPAVEAMWLIGSSFENPNGPPSTDPLSKPDGFPVYLVAGSQDGPNTPTETTTTYHRYQQPVTYWLIDGGNHYGWIDYPHPEDDSGADLPATIHPLAQQQVTREAVNHFLNCHLKDIAAACALIPSTDPGPSPF